MFVILTYDIGTKRIKKVNKECSRYLQRVQKSVFEGNITEANLEKLKDSIKELIETGHDSICIYQIESIKYTSKNTIGPTVATDNII